MRPSSTLTIAFVASMFALTGCSSTPADTRTEEERRATEAKVVDKHNKKQEEIKRFKALPRVMKRLDQAMFDYVQLRRQSENDKAAERADALKRYLEEQSRRFLKELRGKLDSKSPRDRSIAAGALGFSGSQDIVTPLLNMLDDEVPYVRTSACLALGSLADSGTPLDTLTFICLEAKQPIETRRAAGWALLQLQSTASRLAGQSELARSDPRLAHFAKIWPKVLAGDPLANDVQLIVHALRGTGLLRDPSMVDTVTRYFAHPKPFVRQAALIAAARCRNRKAAPMIFPFLTPAESNPNVRLTARKALKALTGDRVDHEYDLEAWKKEFKVKS